MQGVEFYRLRRRIEDFLPAACEVLAGLAVLWILLWDRLRDFIRVDDDGPPRPPIC